MKLSVALSLLALNLVCATPVPGSCLTELSERDTDDTGVPDLCGGAVNCQTIFYNGTGTYGVSFKDNMGPGSAWFARNVEPQDPYSDNYSANAAADSSNTNKITSNLDRSKAKIMWGDSVPQRVLYYGLLNQCFQTSCDADWVHKVHYSTGETEDGGPPSGEVKLHAEGVYPSNKDYYATAIGDIAKKLTQGYNKPYNNCIPVSGGPPSCSSVNFYEYKSGRYFSIVRFIQTNGGKAINGYLHVKAEFKAFENDDVCQDIVSGLTAIMGAGGTVASIGGGFFGVLGSALCQG